MKKSLIALAVMSAAGVASAQTVTVYGLVDLWVGQTKDAAGLTLTKVDSGGVNGSRFGLRGTEDLGGGLKVNFQLEQGFSADTGAQGTTNQMFSRQSWVGLSGGFGAVKVGKTWTAFDDVYGATNFSFDSALSATTYVLETVNYQDRPFNSIRYETPDLNGFNASVSYAFGENKTAAVNAGSVVSVAATYGAGPAFVTFGYQTEKATSAAVAQKYTRLGGSYDFGVAKLLATYGTSKQTGVENWTEYGIGADVPVSSAFTISAGYARAKDKEPVVDVKRSGFSIAGKYDLSKRTFFYGGVVRYKTDGDANTSSVMAAGIQHRF